MAQFVLGSTSQKGCSVCGKDLMKFGGNQALVLKGSRGKVAVCSQTCVDNYDPSTNPEAAAAGVTDDEKPAKADRPAKKKAPKEKKRKPKLK